MSASLMEDSGSSSQNNPEGDGLEYSHVSDATWSVITSEPHQSAGGQDDSGTHEASSSNVQSMLLGGKRKRSTYSDTTFASSDSSYTGTSTTSAYTRPKNPIAQKVRAMWEAYQDLRELGIFEVSKAFRLRFLRRRREHLRASIAKTQEELNSQVQVMALLQQEIEVLEVAVNVGNRYSQKDPAAQKEIERLYAEVKTHMSGVEAFLRDVKAELQRTRFQPAG